MKLLQLLADNSKDSSLANTLRRKRFALFRKLVAQRPRPLSILDIGGTYTFWQQMKFCDESGVSIVILNNDPLALQDTIENAGSTSFEMALGDARDLSMYADQHFDIAFSNSVIEHLGSFEEQRLMISEMRRVARSFFLQTPNYYFPIEPHFHVPGFQFLPFSVRCSLLQHFGLGWTEKIEDKEQAARVVASINLLTKADLRELCPEGVLCPERFMGCVKSWMVHEGWSASGK